MVVKYPCDLFSKTRIGLWLFSRGLMVGVADRSFERQRGLIAEAAMLTREAVWWFYAIALLGGCSKAEKLPLSSIGLCLPTGTIVGFGSSVPSSSWPCLSSTMLSSFQSLPQPQ